MTLEVRQQADESPTFNIAGSEVVMTPAIGEDYWIFRVQLSKTQAMLGFPKFSTIGIGFAAEEDWNTNLPYRCPPLDIWDHIKHNKGDESISDEDCIRAIALICEAAHQLRGTDPVKDRIAV